MTMKQKLMVTLVFLVATPMLVSIVASTLFARDIAGQLLVEQAREKMISVRELKKSHIEDYYKSLRRHITMFSNDGSVKSAAIRFSRSFYQYKNEIEIHDKNEEKASLEDYYQNIFGENYRALNAGKTIDISATIDQLSENKGALQAGFISQNTNPLGNKQLLDAVDENSAYSEEHKDFHPQFRNVLEEYGYYDIFIVDASGDILYSVLKQIDFATSLKDGPYAKSGIGDAFRAAVAAADPSFYYITDFTQYTPSYDNPAAFIASPIFSDATKYVESKLIGVAIFQISGSVINTIMTNKQDWKAVGLGESGETFLVGEDKLMRSSSRFLLEDPESYSELQKSIGTNANTVDVMQAKGTSIAFQPVNTLGIDKALGGEVGFDIFPDYRGVSVLSAYSKLDIPDLNWYIFSEINESEAFAPAAILSESLLLSSGSAALVTLFIAILLGWRFASRLTTPITQLEKEIGEIEAASDLTRRLHGASRDVTVGIVDSLNKMFEKLQDIVKMVATNSKSMETATTHVNEVSAATSLSIQNQSAETDRMTEAMKKITETVVDVANNADEANNAAKEANSQAKQGNEVVMAASDSIHALAQEIQQTSEVIGQLASDGNNIGGVLGVIRSIAEQTNLLALNAAIEAARAGEHGRGFAVVADEVRTLASRTQESTEEIQTMIERLQSGTRNAVTAMTKGQERAEITVSQAGEASEALQKITHSISEITQMNGNIAKASTMQRSAVEEVAEGIRNIAKISTTTTEGAIKAEQATNDLMQLTVDLKRAVQRFHFD
jgi:methyl-accepting chemotaxis protein